MFRWIAIMAAVALAAGAAFAQSSSPQPAQPAMPMGSGQMMGGPMMQPGMMQMMHGGMMGGMMDGDMMGGGMAGPMACHTQAKMGMMGMAGMTMMGAPASHLEGRLAFIKAELAIDQAHDAAWQKYAEAIRNRAQPMFQHMAGMHHGAADHPDFPTQFDAHIKMMEDRLSGMKAVREAAIGLYDGLEQAQKQKADMLLPMSLCL